MVKTMIKQRREILYIYDASYCNPNGDPADENKPRTDPETQVNLVSDVRLKRTIRDYLHEIEGKEIFVVEKPSESGGLKDAKSRAVDFLPDNLPAKITKSDLKQRIDQKIIRDCIDVRLFGCTIPIDYDKMKIKLDTKGGNKDSIIHTGGVQFKMGRSLHKVNVERIKGTAAFPSQEGNKQDSFRIEYILPYSCISFYGVVNEHRGKEVELSDNDLDLLYSGIWTGTKHLITRSKIGQTPRLLFVLKYKEGNFQMSDLDRKIKLVSNSDVDDFSIRSIDDFVLDIDSLLIALEKHREKIDSIELMVDEDLRFRYEGNEFPGSKLENKLNEKKFTVKMLDLE